MFWSNTENSRPKEFRRGESYAVVAGSIEESKDDKLVMVGKLFTDSETSADDSDDLVTRKDERNNELYSPITALGRDSPDRSFSNDLDDVSVVSQACKIGLCKRLGT